MNTLIEIDGENAAYMEMLEGDEIKRIIYRTIVVNGLNPSECAKSLQDKINKARLLAISNNSVLFWRQRPRVKRIDKEFIEFCKSTTPGEMFCLDRPEYQARCRLALWPDVDDEQWEYIK